MVENNEMTGKILAQGIMAAQGEQLRLIYVMTMNMGVMDMIWNKSQDMFNKDIDHSQQRLDREMDKLRTVSDSKLQLELFLHMTREFSLTGSFYNTPQGFESKCEEILNKSYEYQIAKDKKFLIFVNNNPEMPVANKLALYQMQKLVESLGGEIENLTAEQQDTFAEQVEDFLNSLPADKQLRIKEKLGIESITNSTIKRVIVTQGSATLLAVIVEIVGFASYTTLTSLIAGTAGLFGVTLPFVAYTSATSALSILTGPVGFLFIGSVSGIFMFSQSKKVKKTFLQLAIVQLMLPLLLDDSQYYTYDYFIKEWTKNYNAQQNIIKNIDELKAQKIILQAKVDILASEKNDIAVKLVNYNREINKERDFIKTFIFILDSKEMGHEYNNRLNKIQLNQSIISNLRKEIILNNSERTIWNAPLKIFKNAELNNEISKLHIQINTLKGLQVDELIKYSPEIVKDSCNFVKEKTLIIDRYKNDLKKLRGTISVLKEEEQTISKLSSKKKDELWALQRQIYGLADIS